MPKMPCTLQGAAYNNSTRAAPIPVIGEALQEKREKHGQRHEEISVLVNKIRQWLRELPPGTVLEAAPPVRTKLRDDEKVGCRRSCAFASTSLMTSKT